MAIINFKHTENQKLWDLFYSTKIQEAKDKSKDEAKIKMSLNQYKPGLLALEKLTDKQFSDITSDDIELLIKNKQGKNCGHIPGFFITAITESWIGVSKDLIVYLIPKEYRKMVEILVV